MSEPDKVPDDVDAADMQDEATSPGGRRAAGSTGARARSWSTDADAPGVVYIHDKDAIDSIRDGQERLRTEIHEGFDLFSSRVSAAISEQSKSLTDALRYQAEAAATASDRQASLGIKITMGVVVGVGTMLIGVAVVIAVVLGRPITANLPGHIGVTSGEQAPVAAPAAPPAEP